MKRDWICCQLGAREHYAVPRAMELYNRLEFLFTDTWVGPRNTLGSLIPSLGQRFHPDLAAACVYASNVRSIADEAWAKLTSLRGWPLRFSYWQGRFVRNKLFQRAAAKTLARVVADRTPTIVMAYSYMALDILRLARKRGYSTVLGQIDAGPLEDRIVAGLHDGSPNYCPQLQRPPLRYWSDWHEECAIADRIVVNSAWSKTALLSEGVPEGKIKIVPLAYDARQELTAEKEYPAQFTASRPLRVLFLGQINLRKGAGPLLDAIGLLRDVPLQLWLVGPVQIPVPDDLRNHPQVRWFGRVSRADTARFYREADVFMFPTFSDGFGLTQLEAQSWKLPIITTKFCGEVVEDGKNGWLLPEVSATAIAAALRRCIADPDLLRQLSAHSMLSSRFSLAYIGKQWLEVFD